MLEKWRNGYRGASPRGRAAGRGRERGDGLKKNAVVKNSPPRSRYRERERKKKEGRAKACPWLPVLVLLVVRAPLVLHGLQHADVETKLARLVLEHLHGFRLWDRVLREEPESGAVNIVLRASDAPGARGPRNLGRSAFGRVIQVKK